QLLDCSFFQAEDGIRDRNVTGVQTCALPIYERIGHIDQAHEVIERALEEEKHPDLYLAAANLETSIDARLQWLNKVFSSYALQRSEERRVGKECRSR